MIPALVLTAGLATRLRPLSQVRAKAVVPVAGEPLVRRILRWLAAQGVTDAVLNLHHLPHTITGVVGDGTDGVRVRYSWEVPVLGSAGGPRRALPIIGASPFLIVNGDTLTDIDLAALVNDHQRSGALVTMAAIPNVEPHKYSGLAVESDGAVTGVIERGSRAPSCHFVGVQVVEASAFSSLPPDVPCESVGALYPSLIAARRGSVRASVTAGEFFDIGTPMDYLRTSLRLGGQDASLQIGARTSVASDAQIEDSIVWDDVEIEAGTRLHRCIVTDGVRVPARSSWEHVTMRRADGVLCEGERHVGELTVGPVR
jgi:NDP-sugar pyrophosphorylase family protein